MNFSFNRDKNRHVRQPTTASVTSVATGSESAATGRNSSPDDNWETLDLSSTEYARMRRELMQLINDLRSLGQVKNRSHFRAVNLVSSVRRQ